MKGKRSIDKSYADAIWTILVEHCGARDTEEDRYDFVYWVAISTSPTNEYRFGGHLGFGGKFYNTIQKLYVTTYPEDLTPEMEVIIANTDAALAALAEERDDDALDLLSY